MLCSFYGSCVQRIKGNHVWELKEDLTNKTNNNKEIDTYNQEPSGKFLQSWKNNSQNENSLNGLNSRFVKQKLFFKNKSIKKPSATKKYFMPANLPYKKY